MRCMKSSIGVFLICWLLFAAALGADTEEKVATTPLRYSSKTEAGSSSVTTPTCCSSRVLATGAVLGGKQNYLTYGISMDEDKKANDLLAKLTQVDNIEEMVLVSSKSDINY